MMSLLYTIAVILLIAWMDDSPADRAARYVVRRAGRGDYRRMHLRQTATSSGAHPIEDVVVAVAVLPPSEQAMVAVPPVHHDSMCMTTSPRRWRRLSVRTR